MAVARFVPLIATFISIVTCGTAMAAATEPALPVIVEIADVGSSQELADLLRAKGLAVTIPAKNMRVTNEQNNCVVWIGQQVPLETVRVVLPEAIRRYPYLQFFYVVGDRGESPPASVHHTIHIGGSIEAALVMKLNIIPPADMLKLLDQAETIDELHRALHERNVAKPGPAVGNS